MAGATPALGLRRGLRVLDGDDYRWWEVTYTNNEGKPPQSWETVPFGLERLYGSLAGDLVAEDPIPVTPEYIDQFLDRWISWFTLIAGGDDAEIDKTFPIPYKRGQVSEKFKLDKP